jgi:uncharacterized protein YndB with AHSA1/START domain
MTTTAPPVPATPLAFEVPPVVKEIHVPCDAATAFERFTRDIHLWWPVRTFSLNRTDDARVAFEPAVGGRLFERGADGVEHTWGSVSAWEPGRRVAFSWHVGRGPELAQAIEVSFTARDDGTQVRLVHAGWHHLGEHAAEARAQYQNGWERVFMQCYRTFAGQEARS